MQQPNIIDKLHVIEGDGIELNLGISQSNLEKLKSCTIIYHAAASVRFDDPLKSAILLNMRGTREVCELARKMPKLKALVHVSTAYIQPKNLFVEEKIYPSDADWKTYINVRVKWRIIYCRRIIFTSRSTRKISRKMFWISWH